LYFSFHFDLEDSGLREETVEKEGPNFACCEVQPWLNRREKLSAERWGVQCPPARPRTDAYSGRKFPAERGAVFMHKVKEFFCGLRKDSAQKENPRLKERDLSPSNCFGSAAACYIGFGHELLKNIYLITRRLKLQWVK
jgi:hypothetical protein